MPIGSFLLSFFVIWRIWTVHHRLFDRVKSIDNRVVRINSLWLLCVVVLPFAAEMVGEYGDEPVVISLYTGVLLASSLTLVWLAFALHRADPARDRPGLEQLIGNAAGLSLAFVLALAVPGAGYWPLLVLLIDGPVLALARRVGRRKQLSL
ncbi:TMEM175 family protein [Actinoplanes sp. Pm04-4]|uniref:TMEM175 family protein n=1 Tax=Paractinoplanes pyxinae TaxID=2997416 RepID=A0ABT4B690_9ACTN|nr:TMEM175 family protein [Actinoplanes pyxinae]MCY1142001.1 TMEM175 family protein [Actinoplanes pyxinae]